jgi:hypothetical protein
VRIYLRLLVTAKFEMLASFQCNLVLVLASGAFQAEDDLLGGFSLKSPGSVEDQETQMQAPFCERSVWSGHHNPFACDHNDVCLAMFVYNVQT